MSRITRTDAKEQINRIMVSGYRLPDGANTDSLAQVWCEVLDGCELRDFRVALDDFLREGSRWWPKPGEILQRTNEAKARRGGFAESPRDLSARYRRWEQTNEGPCPVCSAVLQVLSSEQMGQERGGPTRFGVFHDAGAHHRAGVPHVGPPYQRRDNRDDERPESKPRRLIAPGSSDAA